MNDLLLITALHPVHENQINHDKHHKHYVKSIKLLQITLSDGKGGTQSLGFLTTRFLENIQQVPTLDS